MTNWVIATVELPSKYIGFNLSPDYVWFNQYDDPYYWEMYSDEYYNFIFNTDISLINSEYVSKKDGNYKGKLTPFVANSTIKNDNGYITFDMGELEDGYKLIKANFPNESDLEWYYIDTNYTTQNIDTDYLKIECDLKWHGGITETFLNNLKDEIQYSYDETGEWGSDINFGYCFYGETGKTVDDLGNDTVYDLIDDGNTNFYLIMRDLNWQIVYLDDDVRVSSLLLYTMSDDKWHYYLMWSDKNDRYYYHEATDKFFNKTWIHVEYSRFQNTATLKIDDKTYEFQVAYNITVQTNNKLTLGFRSMGCPVFKEYVDDSRYYIYDYTQIANIKTYVVPLNQTFDFSEPTVYVRNSNYRDNFFLSVDVENYDPKGYEVLWDTGENTKSLACRFGEYHEVTVTNRAGSSKAWNVAGFGDARFYSYRVDICRDAIPLSDVGNIIRNINYNIINDTEYADNCTITYHADIDSIIVNDGSSIYIDKTEDVICPLREKGYYLIRVSRYDQYASSANGVGFALSWKMKVEGDIGEWLNYSITRSSYTSALDLSANCYGYLLCFDGYGRTGIHLSLKISHGKIYVVAKSVAQTEKWCILPTEFANGEWVDCMFYMYEQNKFFFTVNGYTLLDYSENVNLESVFLFNTVMASSNVILQNIKTPYVNIKDIKRSMQLRKDR